MKEHIIRLRDAPTVFLAAWWRVLFSDAQRDAQW